MVLYRAVSSGSCVCETGLLLLLQGRQEGRVGGPAVDLCKVSVPFEISTRSETTCAVLRESDCERCHVRVRHLWVGPSSCSTAKAWLYVLVEGGFDF